LASAVSEINTTMEEFQSYFAQVQRRAVLEGLIDGMRKASRPESADERRRRLVSEFLRQDGNEPAKVTGATGPEEDTEDVSDRAAHDSHPAVDADEVKVTEEDILRELESLARERKAER